MCVCVYGDGGEKLKDDMVSVYTKKCIPPNDLLST